MISNRIASRQWRGAAHQMEMLRARVAVAASFCGADSCSQPARRGQTQRRHPSPRFSNVAGHSASDEGIAATREKCCHASPDHPGGTAEPTFEWRFRGCNGPCCKWPCGSDRRRNGRRGLTAVCCEPVLAARIAVAELAHIGLSSTNASRYGQAGAGSPITAVFANAPCRNGFRMMYRDAHCFGESRTWRSATINGWRCCH